MKVKLSKWGNSQGIRLSKEILESMNISTDEIDKKDVKLEAKIENGKLIITPLKSPLEELFKDFKGNPEDYKVDIDYGKPVGNEVW